MERFIWLDNEHVANLDAVAYFDIAGERDISVYFRGMDSKYEVIHITDEHALNLKALLDQVQTLGKAEPLDFVRFVKMPRSDEGKPEGNG